MGRGRKTSAEGSAGGEGGAYAPGVGASAEISARCPARRGSPAELRSRLSTVVEVFSNEGVFSFEENCEARAFEVDQEEPSARNARLAAKVPAGPEHDWLRGSFHGEEECADEARRVHASARACKRAVKARCDAAGCEAPGKSCCSRCRCVFFCGPECQASAWPSHKKACRRLARCRELPVEPDVVARMSHTGGWRVGISDDYVFVTCALDEGGGELARRQAWLGGARRASAEEADDVTAALCAAMVSPRHDTNSCAGPRRPSLVTLEATVSDGAQRRVAGTLRRLGVKAVNASSFTDRDWHALGAWAECWYRIDAGLPLRRDASDRNFRTAIPDPVPLPPTAFHLLDRPEPTPDHLAKADALAANLEARRAAATAAALALPVRSVSNHSAIPYAIGGFEPDGDDWAVFVDVFVDTPTAHVVDTKTRRWLVDRPVRLDLETGRPDPALVVDLVLLAIKAERKRPTNILLVQPELCSLIDVHVYEQLFEPLGVRADLAEPRSNPFSPSKAR